ncbi:HupE/UreJ family protein [Ichthyobacterium seriolicida]|uniref:HupE / UreJ protein n=1 Tax=Ichthyobacterium seriolicida TaxID=242600 RepID=A0A1J1E0L6_9FLAO|nr:HupE/UreJ family protein [Ichthyobacterium seriolicida]BAV94469.1 hypothetical protein JBKA6_0456 [Ichthyobacterium seriolicida]
MDSLDNFILYSKIGLNHILDFDGYDHILFIIALCSIYSFKDLKKILYLVTAFTIGHSITLALSVLDIFSLDADLVEFLILVTICATACHNILVPTSKRNNSFAYIATVLFGFIHGMGFSNYLKAILGGVKDELLLPLFGFNVGLEIGQIIVVILLLIFNIVFVYIMNVKKKDYILVTSSITLGMTIPMLLSLC